MIKLLNMMRTSNSIRAIAMLDYVSQIAFEQGDKEHAAKKIRIALGSYVNERLKGTGFFVDMQCGHKTVILHSDKELEINHADAEDKIIELLNATKFKDTNTLDEIIGEMQ